MDTTTETLIPCPFCGSTNLHQGDFVVQCNDCGIEGPSTAHDKTTWNTRAPETPWKPIDHPGIEKIKKDRTPILIPAPDFMGGVCMVQWSNINGLAAFRDWDVDPHDPVHWMPLPLPPQEGPSE